MSQTPIALLFLSLLLGACRYELVIGPEPDPGDPHPGSTATAGTGGEGGRDQGEGGDDGALPPPPPPPVCGNGAIEAGEGCDDGNVDEGDACSPDCAPSAFDVANDSAGFGIAAAGARFMVAWRSDPQPSGPPYGMQARAFTLAGEPASGGIALAAAGAWGRPALAANGDRFVAGWTEAGAAIWSTAIEIDGSHGAPAVVATGGDPVSLRVAGDHGTGFLLTWKDSAGGGPYPMRERLLDSWGSAAFTITGTIAADCGAPGLGFGANGGWVATWRGASGGLVGRALDINGGATTAPIPMGDGGVLGASVYGPGFLLAIVHPATVPGSSDTIALRAFGSIINPSIDAGSFDAPQGFGTDGAVLLERPDPSGESAAIFSHGPTGIEVRSIDSGNVSAPAVVVPGAAPIWLDGAAAADGSVMLAWEEDSPSFKVRAIVLPRFLGGAP